MVQENIIVLIEDNLIEANLTIRAIKKAGIPTKIEHIADGETAIEYLTKTGRYQSSNHPTPMLVLCDIRLPGINGIDVVRTVKQHSPNIPIVMFTSSCTRKDIQQSYVSGANSYITKPIDHEETRMVLAELCHYWLKLNSASMG